MKLDTTMTGLASSSESIQSGTLAVSSSWRTSVIWPLSIKITVQEAEALEKRKVYLQSFMTKDAIERCNKNNI